MRRLLPLMPVLVLLALPARGEGDGRQYALPTPSPSPVPYVIPTPSPTATPTVRCQKTKTVQKLRFSKTTFANVRRHYRVAIRRGWPKTLVLNRRGAAARTKKVLARIKTKAGYDRDQYPPAIGRGRGKELTQGRKPRGWVADVGYVLSPETLVFEVTLYVKLMRFCGGTKFRYVFR